MKRTLLPLFAALLSLGITACQSSGSTETNHYTPTQNSEPMNSFVAIFEIPATDISRAITFYEAILGIDIQPMSFPGMEMGLLPYEGQMVTGVIMQGEGSEPSDKGVTVYLNAGEDLQPVLDKVAQNGGEIVIPKTPHADEVGYFAIFLDTEGNKLGLHSPN